MKHKISILIPCYNAAAFLPELFEGISKQTCPFDEIICYDDCSTDDTANVARRLGAKVLVGKINRGPAFARNRMIECCESDYIHFHDADDLIDERFVEIMKKNIVNKSMQLLCNTHVLDRTDRLKNLGDIVYTALNHQNDQLRFFLENIGFASMGLYSRNALLSVGGFNENLKGNEDPDLHIRLSQKGFVFKSIKEFLVTKLEHNDSFSHKNWFQCLSDKFRCLENYSKILDKKYYPILAFQAAELSKYFYREGDKNLSKKARMLSFNLGIRNIQTSNFSKIISRIFGPKFYLWLYRKRVDLRLI
ncbi:glycosyltransferase family 2 protein [Pedobacter chitinilyticus]|uniref:Glycosyltransferase n=1 Tax=Pedobacter chitinilyticus TaxID=2233776 RepID=A0A3S3R7F7_9SPHI|nr:glycosyltransferase [Pedobacter chitinilyticus]RWU08604.1 glycosyltransferase [Pedobacter chitinilyticus]